jgi:hypothetical protein
VTRGFEKEEEMMGGEEREKEGKGGELGEDGESGELSSKKVNEDELSDSGSDGGGDSDAEEELRREQVLREKLAAAKKKFGGSHVKTINRTLKLVRSFPHQASTRWRCSPFFPSFYFRYNRVTAGGRIHRCRHSACSPSSRPFRQ